MSNETDLGGDDLGAVLRGELEDARARAALLAQRGQAVGHGPAWTRSGAAV